MLIYIRAGYEPSKVARDDLRTST